MTALRSSCALLAVCGLLQTAARASIIIPLSLSNTTGIPSAGGSFGTVTLDTVPVGSVEGMKFTVTSLAPGYFIDKLYFNSTADTLRLVSSSLVTSTPTLNTDAGNLNASEFGKFDFLFNTKDPANFELTTYSFTVVATDGPKDLGVTFTDFIAPSTGNNGGNVFAAHIKTTNNSGFIAIDLAGIPPIPPIPEPASLALLTFGSALLLRRRRALPI